MDNIDKSDSVANKYSGLIKNIQFYVDMDTYWYNYANVLRRLWPSNHRLVGGIYS